MGPKATTRYWFDTEFMEDGTVIEMLSIGMVCEDGRVIYMESADADHSHANEWVAENVLPKLGHGMLLSRQRIAAELLLFTKAGEHPPEFWAYYGDYDWVVLCQLFGTMMDLPESWPMFAMDVKQLCMSKGNPKLPEQTGAEHDALADAEWTRDAHLWLEAQ